MKRIIASILLLLIAFSALSACKRDNGMGDLNDLATTIKHTQKFTDSTPEPGATAAAPTVTNGAVAADNSWQKNYKLTYTITENSVSSELCEQRCDGIYSVTDIASGTVSYFRQNGSNIDQYILNPASHIGTYTEAENQSLSDITTGFMKIAYVDPAFPTYSNVEYQGEATVAGRSAKKYTQSAYTSAGLLTAYAFVWIDTQYGFVSKCQVYSMTGMVNTSWELKEITVGGVTESAIGFSTDGYDISTSESAEG